jgi:hypothetical protein
MSLSVKNSSSFSCSSVLVDGLDPGCSSTFFYPDEGFFGVLIQVITDDTRTMV